jgi:F-type H+-transporting ATPase subunit b
MHAVNATTLLAAEAAEPNPIIPNVSELIVGALAFIVLLVLLSRMVFPRMNQALEERTANIEGKLERAEQQREEAEKLLQQYRDKLASAEDETQRIIDEARANAERVRRDLRAKAEAEAEREIERARTAIRQERNQAIQELRREVGTLAVELATRVVGDSLDRDRQLRLIDRYIDDLSLQTSSGAMTARREDGGRGQG